MTERVIVIVPQTARTSDALENGLVRLTEAIAKRDATAVAHGVLGGEFGYGGHWNSELFQMHPYCWCDEATCPWCYGCACTLGGGLCDWCRHVHRHSEQGALPPDQHPNLAAPHFWHKPSGLRVWWYKWIGRGMEVMAPKGCDVDAILRECIASVAA